MSLQPDYHDWNFSSFVQAARREGLLYDIPVMSSPSNATICLGQQELTNFAGINFLGLQQEEEILAHFTQASRRYGLVTGGSRLIQGVCQPHRDVESLLCHLTGKERAITFASGLLANLGFLHAMSARFYKNATCSIDNSTTTFVLDQDSHWSLRKGVERFPANQQRFYFAHNDPLDLERVLSRLNGRKVVVVFESVYSSDGSIAPLGQLLDVCEHYHALSYVDDANGFLIYGPEHRPFAQEFAHLSRATFVMVSFSKAVGLEGGAIAGPSEAIQAFELLAGTSIFTAAMQPPTASTAHRIMSDLSQNFTLMDRYLDKVADFRGRLVEAGSQLNEMPSYIVSVFLGEDEKVEPVRKAFLEGGYLVPIFHYPVVKFNQALLRIILNVRHTDEQIEGFLDTLASIKRIYRF